MRSLVVSCVGAMLVLHGCEKSDVIEPTPVETALTVQRVNDLPADTAATGEFTFYSLRENAVVASSDSATAKWDIAFSSTRIRINGGASGPGQGGALVLSGTDFDTLTAIPTTGYAIDTSLTRTAIRTGSGNGWYVYDFATNIISPIPGRVLAVRTADGKYAKLRIMSYYKGAPTLPGPADRSRFYTFRFAVRSN